MSKHVSVMPKETISLLDIKEDGIYVDGTLGRGGHSRMILERCPKGKLYCFDLDPEAIEESRENLKDFDNVVFIHDNFKNMKDYVGHVDGILLDLGVSSPQFDEGERGFSYRTDAPLDMRMDPDNPLDAKTIVNTYSEGELIRILREYGEERFAAPIVRNILKKREEKPIETTGELVEIIKEALPVKQLSKKGHPAKQTFQALRIAVNHELDSLETFLDSFDDILNVDGRVVIITFHSLEDRLVKQKFHSLTHVYDDKRIAKRPEDVEKPAYEALSRKALIAGDEEIAENRRARSAKVRGVRKLWQRS